MPTLLCELRLVLQLFMFLFLIHRTGAESFPAEQNIGIRNKVALPDIQKLNTLYLRFPHNTDLSIFS